MSAGVQQPQGKQSVSPATPRHKSAIMSHRLEIDTRLFIPMEEIHVSYARSGGPGGQNVNKVNSKVVLRWAAVENRSLPEAVRDRFVKKYRSRLTKEGELVIHAERFRDAPKNRTDGLARLRAMLLSVASAPKKRKPTKPTKGSIRRRLDNKRRLSDKKRNRRGGRFDD